MIGAIGFGILAVILAYMLIDFIGDEERPVVQGRTRRFAARLLGVKGQTAPGSDIPPVETAKGAG